MGSDGEEVLDSEFMKLESSDFIIVKKVAYGNAQLSTCRNVACLLLPTAGMAVSYRTCTREGIVALSLMESALEGRCWVEETLDVLPVLFGKRGEDCRI